MTVEVEDVRLEYGDATEPYFFQDSRVQLAITEAEGLLSARGISSDRAVRLQAALDMIDLRIQSIRNRPANSVTEGKKSAEYTDLLQIRENLNEKLEIEISRASGCFSTGYNF